MRQLQTIGRSLSRSFLRIGNRGATTALPDRNITPALQLTKQPPLQADFLTTMLKNIPHSRRESIAADIASEQKDDVYRSIQNSPNMHRLFKHLTEQNQYDVLCNLSERNLLQLLTQASAGIALAIIIDTYTLQILHNIQTSICEDTITLPDDTCDDLIHLCVDAPYSVAGILTELNTKHPNLDTDALCIELFSPYFKFSATENKQIPEKIAAIAHTIAATRALDYIPTYKKGACTNDLFKMCLWLHEDDKHHTILHLVTQSLQDFGDQDKRLARFFYFLPKSFIMLDLHNGGIFPDFKHTTHSLSKMLLHHFQTPPINCYKNNDTPV